MWRFTKTFTLREWPHRVFRVRHLSERWQDDVVKRMAVIEVVKREAPPVTPPNWLDFMTIREPDEVQTVELALEASCPAS